MTDTQFRRGFLLLLVVAVSAAFLAMVRSFLLTVVVAALFTGVSYPAYLRMVRVCRGRVTLAALTTLVLWLVLVMVPLLLVAGAVANEALRVNETVRPRLQRLVDEPGELERRLRPLPGYSFVAPYRSQVLIRVDDFLGSAGAFIVAELSAVTRATVVFLFHFLLMLYTMFFFFTRGPTLLGRVLGYLPLTGVDKRFMIDRFVSVTRATIKGTIVIAVAQGALGGLAFRTLGIEGALFWASVMTVLSIIPGIGAPLVWAPAAIILMATGHVGQGLALAVFGALVVGSVDNLCCGRCWWGATRRCTSW